MSDRLPVTIHESSEGISPAMMQAFAGVNNDIALAYSNNSLSNEGHQTLSRVLIYDAMEESLRRAPAGTERRAIILGAGACWDIPIEEIADGFDHTTIVEIDAPTTERSLSRLSKETLGRLSLVRADLSGIVPYIDDALTTALEKPNFNGFIEHAVSKIRNIEVSDTASAFGSDYAFVCSQLVMSQLAVVPYLQFSDRVERRYGSPLPTAEGDAGVELAVAFSELNVKAQMGHVAQLGALVGTDGVVHFADTFFQRTPIGRLPMTTREVAQALHTRFNVSNEDSWNWQPTPKLNFDVYAAQLT